MTGFVLRRLAQLPAVLLATFLVAFALAWVVPGSPFDDAEGRRPSDEVREAMRAQYRLDDPVGFLADYLGKASGVSWALGRAPRPFDLGPSPGAARPRVRRRSPRRAPAGSPTRRSSPRSAGRRR